MMDDSVQSMLMSPVTSTALIPDLPEPPEEDTMSNKYLVFLLDGQEFALELKYVVDIINVQPVTRVPNCPDFIRGVTNLRGKVIPVMDVRMRFGKSLQDYNDRTCIIVVEHRDASVGLVIDSVSEVITLNREQIAPPPALNTNHEARYIQNIGKAERGILLILDCQTVLYDEHPETETDSDSE